MKTKTNLLIALVLAVPAAHAGDGTVARLAGMDGSVLTSMSSRIASAGEGMRLLPGTRVLTTAAAAVTVEYDNGCRVRLERGQRFDVSAASPCGNEYGQAAGVRTAGVSPALGAALRAVAVAR